MPHRCTHIDADGRQCTFYLEDADPALTCPLHAAPSLLSGLRHLLHLPRSWGRPRLIIRDTELFLDPQQRLSRGVLRSGEAIRVLATKHDEWLQVEVVRASHIPAMARGWVRRCAVR
jgi:hypothetical protein